MNAEHLEAQRLHLRAARIGSTAATEKAYGATWEATGGDHPETIDGALADTYDTRRSAIAHLWLANWHREQAE